MVNNFVGYVQVKTKKIRMKAVYVTHINLAKMCFCRFDVAQYFRIACFSRNDPQGKNPLSGFRRMGGKLGVKRSMYNSI